MVNRKFCLPLRPFMRRLVFFLSIVGCLCAPLRLVAAGVPSAAAAGLDSTLRISLLTCSPGTASYELYGHTAIRARSEKDSFDIVFNYGLFNFNQPHFVWHFVLGECDYMVGSELYPYFEYAYKIRGSSITEQVLNLYPVEAKELLQALEENCRPENCTYRYNIFRENCTTKARDIIESHIYGNLRYPMRPRRFTIRQMLHQFTAGSPWDEAGNDLLLGAEVDTLLTERNETFLPIYMMWYADSILIERGYMRFVPFVSERRVILEANPEVQQLVAEQEPTFPIAPTLLFWALLVLALLLAVWETRARRIVWGVDLVLMLLQGLAGVLLLFMALFSTHPAVGSNWQVWVLNPLPLFFLPAVVRADIRRESCVYHVISAAILVLFLLLSFFIPQDFTSLIYPLALLLLSRAIVHLVVHPFNR